MAWSGAPPVQDGRVPRDDDRSEHVWRVAGVSLAEDVLVGLSVRALRAVAVAGLGRVRWSGRATSRRASLSRSASGVGTSWSLASHRSDGGRQVRPRDAAGVEQRQAGMPEDGELVGLGIATERRERVRDDARRLGDVDAESRHDLLTGTRAQRQLWVRIPLVDQPVSLGGCGRCPLQLQRQSLRMQSVPTWPKAADRQSSAWVAPVASGPRWLTEDSGDPESKPDSAPKRPAGRFSRADSA